MQFRVRQLTSEQPSYVYRYLIFAGDRLVARYWHDHRGDEHGIEFVDGRLDDWPVGRMTDFLTGLSDAAVNYLRAKLSLPDRTPAT
jgi:hypothetical protein